MPGHAFTKEERISLAIFSNRPVIGKPGNVLTVDWARSDERLEDQGHDWKGRAVVRENDVGRGETRGGDLAHDHFAAGGCRLFHREGGKRLGGGFGCSD